MISRITPCLTQAQTEGNLNKLKPLRARCDM